MPIPNVSYPFDHTGVASTNLVQGERQIIPPANAANFVTIIPFAAPYYRASLRVIYVPTGQELVEGVDYRCTNYFYEATTKIGQPIYGSITMLDRSMTGSVDLRYQTIGGDWTLNQQQMQQVLAQNLLDPRTATWEQIVELPYAFPPINHPHELPDLTGFQTVVDACYAIAEAIEAIGTGANASHVDDKNNPHDVNKAQVGLPLVQNYPVASSVEASAGLAANRYMTPAGTKIAIADQIGTAATAHHARQDNPHGTSKQQVGLGFVQNYGVATLQEATAGEANNLYITPYLMAAYFNARAGQDAGAHALRNDNPHGVNKAQIGLDLVPNWSPATAQIMLDGASNNSFVTPYLVRIFVNAVVGDVLQNHLSDLNNPHQTTKAQVGLELVPNLGLATVQAAQQGVADSGIMTPRLTREAMIAFLQTVGLDNTYYIVSSHISDHANPHQVTAAQVDAYTINQVDGLLGNKLGLHATADNAALLNGQSATQIIEAAKNRVELAAVNGATFPNETWTRIAQYLPGGPTPVADIAFYMQGGDPVARVDAPLYLVQLNVTSGVRLTVSQISGRRGTSVFGYVYDSGTGEISIYVMSQALRGPISLMPIADIGGCLGRGYVVYGSAPTGFKAHTAINRDSGINLDAVPGEVPFGYNPHVANPAEPDLLVHTVNVATDAGELAAAGSALNDLDELDDWVSMSAYGVQNYDAVPDEMLDWVAFDPGTNINTGVRLDRVAEPASLLTYRDKNSYTDYVFEVIVSSTDSARNALGVCAASVRENGRDYGIYVFRTPGGLTTESGGGALPGGDIYRHLTVVLNPFQDDAVNLGSTNASVSPSASGWGLVGECKIRVEKVGSTLTIKTSQLGSTVIDEALTVTVDLESLLALERFRGPCYYGVASFKQASAVFDITIRPGRYVPYIDNFADFEYKEWNGVAWSAAVPLKINNPQIKPGRILHSPLNGKLYRVRRNGRLKELTISA